MPIITSRKDVLAIYREASDRGWVLPCFCSENLTTTEAVLAAALAYGKRRSLPDLPIIIAITNNYPDRTQSTYYTHTRRWDIGLKLFLADLQVLAEPGTPYENLRIMIHLDHIQHDVDEPLLSWDLNAFSSIMFDASKVPFADNIRLTRQFVRTRGDEIVVEGACDEIVDASGTVRSELTTAERAETFFQGTGADMIVANLGTEHRASSHDRKYYGDYARRIKEKIGNRIVLHGASSVSASEISSLFADGICKVNLWTALERDASPVLFRDMLAHAVEVAGAETAAELKQAGLLGPAVPVQGRASIDYFTTTWRQGRVYSVMQAIVESCLSLWYI